MNRLMGVVLASAMLLAACGGAGDKKDPIPAARLAPIAQVEGVIPAEADRYGVLTFGSTGGETTTTFSEPYFPIVFDSTGAFTFTLPDVVTGGFSDYPGCPFDGHAGSGSLYALASPSTDGTAPTADILATYRLESEEALAFFWYSPATMRVRCTSTASGNMSGGLLEDWDLQLQAGWNQVVAYLTPTANYFRTGQSDASWVAMDF